MQGDFFLTQWVFLGMRWLFDNVTGQSIVLTVIISTIIIRALTVFGDIKSRKSSAKMQTIQPMLDKVRKKYEKDPEKLNRETQKIMRENGVSMFGGCLPMLFTMPLFFIFIAAFRQWGNEMMVKLIVTLENNEEAGVEMFKTFKFLWINNMWQPDSGLKPVIQSASELFSTTNNIPKLLIFQEHPEYAQLFEKLGFFIKDATSVSGYALNIVNGTTTATASSCACAGATAGTLSEQAVATYNSLIEPCKKLYEGYNNGWFLLPILCCGTTFLSSWIMTKNQPKNDTTNSSMKMMQWLMPAMTFVFCLSTNACFALYWTVSNVVSTITTLIINKKLITPVAGATEENK